MSYLRAFSSLGCAELMLDDVLALAGRHALTRVELRALAGSTDLPAYFTRHFQTPARLAAHLRPSPVKVSALDTSFKLGDNTPTDRAALLQFIPWAEALGVPHLRVFDGSRLGEADSFTKIIAALGWWRELRKRNGWAVDLMVETHDAMTTTESTRLLLAAAPGTAILWDTHHTWKLGGEDPLRTWRALKDHIVMVHLKDSVSRPSAQHPYSYVLPGTGEFPAAPLLAVLREEYAGVITLEWEKLWHPYLPPLEDALVSAACRNWW